MSAREKKHTPTPWTKNEATLDIVRLLVTPETVEAYQLVGADDRSIGYLHRGDEVAQANAELIVRAVNAHDDLVKALENLAHEAARMRAKLAAANMPTGYADHEAIRDAEWLIATIKSRSAT